MTTRHPYTAAEYRRAFEILTEPDPEDVCDAVDAVPAELEPLDDALIDQLVRAILPRRRS